MNLKEYKKKALSKKSFREEYNKYDIAFEIGQMVIEARMVRGVTQEKLAELVNTKQPSIARLEKGGTLPSLRFLENIAKALGTFLIAPRFASTKEQFLSFVLLSDSNEYKSISEDENSIPHQVNSKLVGGTCQRVYEYSF